MSIDPSAAAKTAFKVAKTGWNVYSTVRDTVDAVTKPLQWLRDKLKGLLVSAVLAAFKLALGPKLTELARNRLDFVGKTLPFDFSFTVPAAAVDYLADADGMRVAQEVVNEALSAPLKLMGWRVGLVTLGYDPETRLMRVDLEVGVMEADAVATAVVQAKPADESPSTTLLAATKK